MCLIQCRTYEVSHAGVDDGKSLANSFLDVDHTCNQRPALSHDSPAQLKMKLLSVTELQMIMEKCEIRIEISYRMLVGIIIINTQSAPYILLILSKLYPVAPDHPVWH